MSVQHMLRVFRAVDGIPGDFSCFMWTGFSKTLNWNDVESCVKYLTEKGVQIDDSKRFDQFSNLKKCMEGSNSDEELNNFLANYQKWIKYFEKSKTIESCC
ncbi:leucine-rich repeat-containing protein 26-like [Platysternon megacephalum]|uniref:Leucine-rich repeat-containing protein 26-like n=1 Tax=Platysternon megacephalum TaxID=55544 RepID=A0A4D9DYU6_9SAUR|nr:leucine-rich repeat-containing protein 26-like [Platysternon megacephalum]